MTTEHPADSAPPTNRSASHSSQSRGLSSISSRSGIACITAIIRVPPTDWRFIIPRGRLQRARARLGPERLADVNGLASSAEPPLLHFAKRQDMVAWAPTSVDAERAGSAP